MMSGNRQWIDKMRVRALSIASAAGVLVLSVSTTLMVHEYQQTLRGADHELRTVALSLAAYSAFYSKQAEYLLDRSEAAVREANALNLPSLGLHDISAPAAVGPLEAHGEAFEDFGAFDYNGSSVNVPTSPKHRCSPRNLFDQHKRIPNLTVRLSASNCRGEEVLLHLTRRIQNDQGKFVGVAFVSFNAKFFIEYLRTMHFDTRGRLSIYSDERHILDAKLNPDIATLFATPNLSTRARGPGNVSTQFGGAPLEIALQTSTSGVPPTWWRFCLLTVAVALSSLGGIIAITIVLDRWLRQHKMALVALAELEDLKRAAEDANRAKSEYLAIMSHEIRTSMSGVLGMAEFMLRSKLYKEQHSGVKVLYDAGQNLVQIINKVLDFSKIESGSLELIEVAFEAGELIGRVGDLYSKEAYNKGISLEIFRPSRPVWVRGDDLRIRQILTNFVGNALKFTTQGGVSISLRTEVVSGARDQLRLLFKVRDTGPGIAAGMQDGLFQPFHQARNEATREVAGTGLGLSICKRLSDLMDGKIWVESVEGIGSTFYLQVDCASAQSTDQISSPAAPELPHDGPVGRASILLVEDNLSNQEIARKYLERDGYTVTCADDGVQAVELFRTERFDIILMDGSMPVMDGYESTRRIRCIEAHEGRVRTPIIATTANTGDENEKKCLDAGMDDFIPKPYRFSDLRVKITKFASSVLHQPNPAHPSEELPLSNTHGSDSIGYVP